VVLLAGLLAEQCPGEDGDDLGEISGQAGLLVSQAPGAELVGRLVVGPPFELGVPAGGGRSAGLEAKPEPLQCLSPADYPGRLFLEARTLPLLGPSRQGRQVNDRRMLYVGLLGSCAWQQARETAAPARAEIPGASRNELGWLDVTRDPRC
jgi:hypothetical protein